MAKNYPNSPWTDARKERVKELWATHSATQISDVLAGEGCQVSRNAVIGTLHRMGLTASGKTETRAIGTKVRRETNSSGKFHATVARIQRMGGHDRLVEGIKLVGDLGLRCVEILPRNLTLAQLDQSAECHYIPGDDSLYCGHPQYVYLRDNEIRKSSYCSGHYFLTRQAPKPFLDKVMRRAA